MRTLFLLLSVLLLFSCGQNNGNTATTSTDSSGAQAIIDTSKKDTTGSLKPVAYNQDITVPSAAITSFITEGYTALDTTSGDLNLDQYPDMILVLKKNGEDTSSDVTEHPEKRPLLILTGQPDHSYKLAARGDNAVYCIDCGGVMGDPFMDIVIKKGYFSVEHYGGSSWRWTRTITFKYSPADSNWYLHKDGTESFHASDPEKKEIKIHTTKDFGKMALDKFDIYKD